MSGGPGPRLPRILTGLCGQTEPVSTCLCDCSIVPAKSNTFLASVLDTKPESRLRIQQTKLAGIRPLAASYLALSLSPVQLKPIEFVNSQEG